MKILCEIHNNWRTIVINAMQAAGIVSPKYTGKIEFTLNEGLIIECQRYERIMGNATFQEKVKDKEYDKGKS